MQRRICRIWEQRAGASCHPSVCLSWRISRPFGKSSPLILGNRRDLQIVDEVSDGLEAVQRAQELKPDLILLDIGLPRLNGIDAARRIRKVSPGSKILFLSQESSGDVIQEALSLGAMGYVVKAQVGSDLLEAVEAVILGKPFVSAMVNYNVSPRSNPNPASECGTLSILPQEVEFQ